MQGNRQGGGHRTTAGKPNVGPMAKRETKRFWPPPYRFTRWSAGERQP